MQKMTLPPIELGRLAVMQRSPLRYVERRVEYLDLPDDYHYGVTVRQQIVVPFHGDGKEKEEPRDLLVPLGQFSKDQMPDLQVLGPDGSALPLLSRPERGYVGATLFTTRWQAHFFRRLPNAPQHEAQALWGLIHVAVAQVVTGSAPKAYLAIYRLKSYLVESSRAANLEPNLQCFLLAILGEDKFWQGLRALAESRLLVGKLRGVPGHTYIVTIQYTERFHYRGYSNSTVSGIVRKGLAWLGLIGTPIARSVANLGQAASLWVVQSIPEGAEALRYYWRKDGHVSQVTDPISVENTRAVASRHQDASESSDKDLLLLDVQISPSPAIAATIALAALLLVVSTYVYQALPDLRVQPHVEDRLILVGLGSIFSALPAGIAGALAYRGQTFVRRASRGPRTLLAILSALAAFFAAVVSLKNLGGLAESVAYSLSVYCVVIIGVFSFIQLGPRWRKNERSRNKAAAERSSPNDYRKRQIRHALVFVAAWTIVVLVFARSQAVLQHEHFFTSKFPANVWHAWWSWFGL